MRRLGASLRSLGANTYVTRIISCAETVISMVSYFRLMAFVFQSLVLKSSVTIWKSIPRPVVESVGPRGPVSIPNGKQPPQPPQPLAASISPGDRPHSGSARSVPGTQQPLRSVHGAWMLSAFAPPVERPLYANRNRSHTRRNDIPSNSFSNDNYASFNSHSIISHCDFCGETNHRRHVCRYGMPVTCFQCHRTGHKEKFCELYPWSDGEEGGHITNFSNTAAPCIRTCNSIANETILTDSMSNKMCPSMIVSYQLNSFWDDYMS